VGESSSLLEEKPVTATVADNSLPDLKPLTSLRFFAAAMIVWVHISVAFGIESTTKLTVANCGFVQGVSLFFVLSGFILTYKYGHGFKTATECLRFFIARLARIWPAHAAVNLIFMISLPAALWYTSRREFPLIALANFGLIHSFFVSPRYHNSINLPSWSVSTEFGFYLLFPLMVANFKSTWLPKLIGSAVLAVACVALAGFCYSLPDSSHWPRIGIWLLSVNPLARLFEFTLGMVACLAMIEFRSGLKHSWISATCLEMLALSIIAGALAASPQLFSLTRQNPSPFVHAMAFWLSFCGGAFGYALLIFSLSLEKGMCAQLLKAPYLVKLGEISYSMYLLHYLIMLWFQCYLLPAPLTQTGFKCLSYCSLLIASSMLVYKFIEVPARAFIRRRSERLLGSETIAHLSSKLQRVLQDSKDPTPAA